jgi:hypothetical protein
MAKMEMVQKLTDRIVELEMALITATGEEFLTLNSVKNSLTARRAVLRREYSVATAA